MISEPEEVVWKRVSDSSLFCAIKKEISDVLCKVYDEQEIKYCEKLDAENIAIALLLGVRILTLKPNGDLKFTEEGEKFFKETYRGQQIFGRYLK